MGRIVIVAYRPKHGNQRELDKLIAKHTAVLYEQRLITKRPSTLMKSRDGTVIEVFEWRSKQAIEQAHQNPAVQKMWREYAEICDYVPLNSLPEAEELFAEFSPFQFADVPTEFTANFLQHHAKPIVCGHRGASGYAPENTVSAFHKAIQLGAQMIEFDVQQTKDGELILFHDKTLTRTSDGRGQVTKKYLHELLSLDAGSWFSQKYENEKIPSLEETFALFNDKCLFNIEIKNTTRSDSIIPKLIQLIDAHDIAGSCIVTSFDHHFINAMKITAPGLRYGYIMGMKDKLPDWNSLTIDALSLHHLLITKKLMAKARAANKLVFAWTVNRPTSIRRMLRRGVDGIITNYPDRIFHYMKKLGYG